MAGTEMREVDAPGGATVTQRWLARLALAAATAAVLVAPVVAGFRQSLALVLVGLAGLALTLAGVWWALTNRGLVRGLAITVAVAAPLVVLVLYSSRGCSGSCWWGWGCRRWPSPPARPPCAPLPSLGSCPSTRSRRPGGRT